MLSEIHNLYIFNHLLDCYRTFSKNLIGLLIFVSSYSFVSFISSTVKTEKYLIFFSQREKLRALFGNVAGIADDSYFLIGGGKKIASISYFWNIIFL